ncbi:hypothetical protein Tco_1367093, partial [Tanacetum coccineum]
MNEGTSILKEPNVYPILTGQVLEPTDGTSYVQEEPIRIHTSECSDSKKAHSGDESPVDKGSIPTPSKTKESGKRCNDGIDMNKKTFYPKTKTSKIAKPAPSNRVQEKRKNFNKNKSSSMQISTTCGFRDLVQDIKEASTPSIITADSCKRSLNFDDHIAKESNLVSKPHEEPPRLESVIGDLYNFGTIVTSKRNTPRRSRFPKKSPKALEYLLGDIFVTRNQDKSDGNSRKDIHVFLKHYKKQRSLRKRMKIHRCCDKADEDGKSSVRRSNRNPIPINRKSIQNTVDKPIVKKKVVKPNNIYIEEGLHRVFSPLRRIPIRNRESLVPRNEENSDTDEGLISLDKGMIEILTGKLASLDIDYRCKELMVLKNNVISGALVKRVNKKRKFTPVVDLNNESLRVWKLLMENDGSEPVEEMDKDREEWWESQRNIFRGRVDSFICQNASYPSSSLKDPCLEFDLLHPVLFKRHVIPSFGVKAITLKEEGMVPSALLSVSLIG